MKKNDISTVACIHRCVFAYANDGVNNGWAVAVASEF